MSLREHETHALPPLLREALDWIVHLTSGSATEADARAFDAWRSQGAAHADALREAVAFREAVRAMPLSAEPNRRAEITNIGSRLRSAPMNRRAMLAGGMTLAASSAALMISPPYGLWPSLAELGAGERTGVAERRLLRPIAGVTVEMNARTAINLDTRRRRAVLVAGEAFAAVAHADGPFSVQVGDALWSSEGGEFNIRTSGDYTCVSCIAGRVLRDDGGAPLTIVAGQQVAKARGEPGRVSRMENQQVSAWRQGLLIFRDTPLAVAVEDINRYRTGRIILADESIGRRPVSGMFHTAQIENAVAQIQQLLRLNVTQMPGGVILMS